MSTYLEMKSYSTAESSFSPPTDSEAEVATDDFDGEASSLDRRRRRGDWISCAECSDRAQASNHLAFWLLGLCNNFGYVVMLSGAHDILQEEEGIHDDVLTNSTTIPPTVSSPFNSTAAPSGCISEGLRCNKNSTGIILLADILPTLIIKLTAPYYMHSIRYKYRVATCVLFALLSYIVVAVSHAIWLSLIGVVFASISAGLGEITFLSLTSHFVPTTVSYWSSGTGAAGAVGAWSYLALRYFLSPRDTLLVMTVIPVLMAISYWVILQKPHTVVMSASEVAGLLSDDGNDTTEDDGEEDQNEGRRKKRKRKREPYPGARTARLPLVVKLRLMKPLVKYMAPLFVVYYAEYTINQGLYELMIWRDCIRWVSPDTQYRWFQALYQMGVFVSRSSVQIFPIKRIWILSFLQCVNVGLLFWESYEHIFPSIFISFLITFYEGLLGGGCYVNAFYRIRQEVEPENCEFSLGVASVADSCGIALAGATAIPIHDHVCSVLAKKF